jgi:hypothetical protein
MVRLIHRIPPRWRPWVGTGLLLFAGWVAMHGHLWWFDKFDAHRMTARAMMSGTLRLRNVVTLVDHDEQVHDGAVFTNWSYGVPLLQIPFHALASALGVLHGFFPDRTIYFLYFAASMPILWAAIDRVLAARQPEVPATQRLVVSWAAVWLLLNVTLFPFMTSRFIIFEETLAYMILCELMTLSAWVFAQRSRGIMPTCAMGVASGLGLLVRPTGGLYVAMWGLLVALDRRARRTVAFALTVAPFAAFWLYSNWARSGSILGLGYQNSNPAWAYEMPILRFGSACADTTGHALYAAVRLFVGFFFYVRRYPSDPWMRQCHFDMEERDDTGEPYFGPAVLLLLCVMVYGLAKRRERRIAMYLPYAGFLFLFVAFVRRGEGFAWRYVGDFWPLITLACVQHVLAAPAAATVRLDMRLAKWLFWGGTALLVRFHEPWEWNNLRNIDPVEDTGKMWDQFRASRWGVDQPLPAKVSCGDPIPPVYDDRLGWNEDCSVVDSANVYLGVVPKADDRYVVRFATSGMELPTLRIYLNGRVYVARRNGDAYEADVRLRRDALTSPIVVVTIEWPSARTKQEPPPAARLLSVELG